MQRKGGERGPKRSLQKEARWRGQSPCLQQFWGLLPLEKGTRMLLPPQLQSLISRPHVQLSLLQCLQDATTLLRALLLFMTQKLLSKAFPPATSTPPPPLAFPVLLFLPSFLFPFQLFLFFPTFCLFLTLSPPVSLSLSLSALHASICSPSPHPVQHWDDHNLPFPQQGQKPLDSPGPHSSQRAQFLAQLTLHSRIGGRSP